MRRSGPLAFGNPSQLKTSQAMRSGVNDGLQQPVPQLLAELEFLGNGLVTIEVGVVEVIQQTPALANHHQ